MVDAPANNAQLTATIKFIAKMDEKSFGAVKNKLKEMNPEMSGEAGAPQYDKTPNTRKTAQAITKQPSLVDNVPGAKQEDFSGKSKYTEKEGLGEIMGAVTGVASGKGIQAPKEEAEGAAGGGMGKGGAAMVGIGAAMKIFESIFAVIQKLYQLIAESSPLMQATNKLFMTSMKILFMPLGNMIAKVLMPIMMKYMQKSVDRMSKLTGNESIQELTTGAMQDMIGALMEIFGTVMSQIMPGVVMGIVDGIKAALFGGNTKSAVTNAMSPYQDEYNKNIAETNGYLTEFNTGLAEGLDRFGMVMYTANNKAGKASSDMATTIYKSSRTIENGFDETSTVWVQGTTKAIDDLNKSLNLVAAGATFTYNTITGQAQAFGTKITQALKDIGGAFNSFVDPIRTPITKISNELGKLATPISKFNNELGNLTATVANTIAAIEMKLRKDSLAGVQPAKIKWNNDLALRASSLAAGITETQNATSLTHEEAYALGVKDIKENEKLYVRQAGGRFIITDTAGEIRGQGISNMEDFQSRVNTGTMKEYMPGGGMFGAGWTYAREGNALPTLWADVMKDVYGNGTDNSEYYTSILENLSNNSSQVPAAEGGIFDSPTRTLMAEAGKKEAAIPLSKDLTDRYSNEEIYSRLKNATTPGISNLDQKIDSASGANGGLMGAMKKSLPQQITLQVIIQGDVYTTEKIEDAVKNVLQQNAYLLKGSY